MKVYETYEDFDYNDLLLYAGIDCIVTSELLSKLFDILVEEPLYIEVLNERKTKKKVKKRIPSILESYLEFTKEAHEFIIDMELNGIKYDVDLNRKIKEQMETEIAGLEAAIFQSLGKKIDLNSGPTISELIYEEYKIEAKSFTKTGEPSTDGDSLKALSEERPDLPWLGLIAKRNDIASLYRTFIATYVEDFVKSDGRIHPLYNLTGTGSFRITGEDPNLTQLPRPKHGYNIRDCFIVEEGNCFITADFSSAEVKILGALCKDPALLKAIEEGKDFHSFSASRMLGIEYEDFVEGIENKTHSKHKYFKEQRQFAKALTFGILYGSSSAGIAFNIGISKEKAEELIRLYFNTFPGIKTYVENTHEMALLNQYVFGPFYQRKHTFGTLPVFKGTAVYNGALRLAQNVRVQNTASSFGLFCFTKLNQAIKRIGGKCLCTVYDSIELEVPIDRAAEAVELIYYYLNEYPVEYFTWLDLPVGIEVEIGKSWGSAEVVHKGVTQEEILKILSKQ